MIERQLWAGTKQQLEVPVRLHAGDRSIARSITAVASRQVHVKAPSFTTGALKSSKRGGPPPFREEASIPSRSPSERLPFDRLFFGWEGLGPLLK